MIVAGGSPEFMNKAEAVSLSGQDVNCPGIAGFPYAVSYITSAMLNGDPVICGGVNYDQYVYSVLVHIVCAASYQFPVSFHE
jgi:hypothetical protein